MKPRKSLIALTALALVSPLAVHAQQPSDPILGTWKLNVAKSTFEPGPALQGETRTYVQTPAGIDFTDQVVTANGDTHILEISYNLDGKTAVEFAPAGGPSYHLFTVDPNIGSARQTQITPYEARANLVIMLQGKVVIIGHRTQVESMDGKTLTLETTLTTRTGQPEHDVEVFDRQ